MVQLRPRGSSMTGRVNDSDLVKSLHVITTLKPATSSFARVHAAVSASIKPYSRPALGIGNNGANGW
jgi:hypothetical protein